MGIESILYLMKMLKFDTKDDKVRFKMILLEWAQFRFKQSVASNKKSVEVSPDPVFIYVLAGLDDWDFSFPYAAVIVPPVLMFLFVITCTCCCIYYRKKKAQEAMQVNSLCLFWNSL